MRSDLELITRREIFHHLERQSDSNLTSIYIGKAVRIVKDEMKAKTLLIGNGDVPNLEQARQKSRRVWYRWRYDRYDIYVS